MLLEETVGSVLSKYSQHNFLVAVSGGADSIALLSSLCACVCKQTMSLYENIHVLHVDHGLRGQESKDDAEFVRAFCDGLSTRERPIPCVIVSIPQGDVQAYAKSFNTGIEASARHFRRNALLNEAKRLDKPNAKTLILTAHNKDDMLELSLMRLLRGSGPAGLSAMPVKRGRFVRPLLGVTRAEIIACLKEKNIPWREDSSNTDEKFLRNKIRHKLIPFLDELFPTWKKGVFGASLIQSQVADFLSSETEKRIIWEEAAGLFTDETNFFLQPLIIREEAIYQAVNRCAAVTLCEKTPKRYVVRRFCEGSQKAADLGPVRIVRKKGKIILSPGLKRTPKKTVN